MTHLHIEVPNFVSTLRVYHSFKNLPFFEIVNMFTKLHEPIDQGIRPLNLGRRKRMTWYPFLHTLTPKTMSQIFETLRLLFFYMRIKIKKGKKTELPANKKA